MVTFRRYTVIILLVLSYSLYSQPLIGVIASSNHGDFDTLHFYQPALDTISLGVISGDTDFEKFGWVEFAWYWHNDNLDTISMDTINGEAIRVWDIWNVKEETGRGTQLEPFFDPQRSKYIEVYVTGNFKFMKEYSATKEMKFFGVRRNPGDFGGINCDALPTTHGVFNKINVWGGGNTVTYHYDRTFDEGGGDYTCPWSSSAYVLSDSTVLINGQWYNVTLRVVANTFVATVPQADGIFEVWIDGRMVWQEDDIKYFADEDSADFNVLGLDFFHGGSDIAANWPAIDSKLSVANLMVWMPEDDSIIGNNTHSSLVELPHPFEITDRTFDSYDSLKTTATTISTGNWPSNYVGGQYDTWLLTAPEGYLVHMVINEGSLNSRDYVTILDGDQTSSTILYKKQGVALDDDIIESTGNKMYVVFAATYPGGNKGFTATITHIAE